MYLACSTRARMSGTDMTHLRGATHSDSLQACEVDHTCQYHQHGFHMSVAMPKKFTHVRAQVSACRQFWMHGLAGWDPSLRVLVRPACQRSMGPACQSLVGPTCDSFGGSGMPEICGARMSELGGSQHAQAWWAQPVRVWTQHVRTCGARMSELGGSLVPFPSGPHVAVGLTGFTRCPTCQLRVVVSLGQIG